MFPKIFDIIVVGAGHAGVEASLAASRMGLTVLTATTRLSRISYMACNPSIGGLAKGNLVKEIDVLGGIMALAGDSSCLQYKQLNSKKGPAVRGSRVQCDKLIYQNYVKSFLERQKNIHLIEEEIQSLWIRNGVCLGVLLKESKKIKARAVILTAGTFMGAVMHTGKEQKKGARIGDQATYGLSEQLKSLGFKVTRLKTGTPPRLHKNSIHWEKLQIQNGDKKKRFLSFFSKNSSLPQKPCYLSHTNLKTHEIIRKNLSLSPLFSGAVKAVGPRYCPSIEDKVVRFPEKISHQSFLEPETLNGNSIYVQGLSTSLPRFVQEKFIRSIKGLENAKFLEYGYAVEYDFINPIQIYPTLETKILPGLFLAGQVNGSSGYEEAAIQGLSAGVNASSKILNLEPFILERHLAYGGVLIDDLVTKGTLEPYRMLTSRAEHRLILREDNTLERLFPLSKKYRLLSKEKIAFLNSLLEKRKTYKNTLHKTKWTSKKLNSFFENKKLNSMFKKDSSYSAWQLLKRPEISCKDLEKLGVPKASQEITEPVEIENKYEGYILIQNQRIKRNQKMIKMSLQNVDYKKVKGLSSEAREKLLAVQPKTLDQAQRVSGVSPSSLQALIIHVHGLKSTLKAIRK